ncbi:MAG TPA: TIGR01459 family HAD-type hydrolase [Alphaproteobacteria bacterium]|nr:TIGR01459 family HAD-type hydrolase [Alphaproteobacteria bacterium]
MTRPEIAILHGLSALAARFDGYILDLWGVLHDGVTAYPGAIDCLERLHMSGKRIAILSNAPRRASEVARRSAELGIVPGLYDVIHSSGEEAWLHLKDRPDQRDRRLGRACYHLGPARDRGILEGLDLVETTRIAEASFLLNTGAHLARSEIADYEPVLEPAAERGLPMVCANPDLEVIRGGVREICAGMLALRYEELGGRVYYHGKPHESVYRRVLTQLGLGPTARILAVGDSLRTDIAGARRAGLSSLLVTGGIHAEELGLAAGAHPEPSLLAEVCSRAGERPDYATPAFIW